MIAHWWILTFVFLVTTTSAFAQYFQFSQYNFTQQRINPAVVASTDDATLGMIYRNQATAGDVTLRSTMLSAMYPLLSSKTGARWSGIGITAMDDRSAGIFTVQEASISYAINIFPAKYQSLSLGAKALYQQRGFNMNGLYTGSQYIPDRGFDQSISNGEHLQSMRSTFTTFSTGMYWQRTDKIGRRVAYMGLSIFDFNKPEDSFLGATSQLSSTGVLHTGVQIYNEGKISVVPELLLTRTSSNNTLNVGFVTGYEVREKKKDYARIDLITKYVLGRSAIVGIQLHREQFSVGVSYDFPFVTRNAANFNTIEIGLEWRKPVSKKIKRRIASRRNVPDKNVVAQKKPIDKKTVNAEKSNHQPRAKTDSIGAKPPRTKTVAKAQDLKTTLKQKQDSVLASAEAGKIRHEPLLLETIMLHFNFDFNSSDLDDPSEKYLNDLAEALSENEHLRIKLTGHTDNIGSAKFNQKLSLYRAQSIKEYLVEKGIDAGRIDTEGKGLTEPLTDNNTEEGRAKNRRVEMKILYGDE